MTDSYFTFCYIRGLKQLILRTMQINCTIHRV